MPCRGFVFAVYDLGPYLFVIHTISSIKFCDSRTGGVRDIIINRTASGSGIHIHVFLVD